MCEVCFNGDHPARSCPGYPDSEVEVAGVRSRTQGEDQTVCVCCNKVEVDANVALCGICLHELALETQESFIYEIAA